MQPFLTAFEYVCLYTIGAYCQQVYRSLNNCATKIVNYSKNNSNNADTYT